MSGRLVWGLLVWGSSPVGHTCAKQAGSESAAQISVIIWSRPGVRQSIQSTRRSARYATRPRTW